MIDHFIVSLQRPQWHVQVNDDKDRAVATRRRILNMVATDRLLAIGYTCRSPPSAG